jgi:hypothetical protein
MPTLVATLPFGPEQCMEKYMTLATLKNIAAGFTSTDLFISEGPFIFKFTTPAGPLTLFTTISPGMGTGACQFSDHSSLKFDQVGTFGFNLTMTCEGGDVFTIDGSGNVVFVGTFAGKGHDPVHTEGQEVMPLSFGPLGGKLLATDENLHGVTAMDNLGNVISFNAFNWTFDFGTGVENIRSIPTNPCTFGCIAGQPSGTFFQMVEDHGFSAYYPLTDFTTNNLTDGLHVPPAPFS